MKSRRMFLKEAGTWTVLAPLMAQPLACSLGEASMTTETMPKKDAGPLGFKPHPVRRGDGKGWEDPKMDEKGWEPVVLPDTWKRHSDYDGENSYGWYRRTV